MEDAISLLLGQASLGENPHPPKLAHAARPPACDQDKVVSINCCSGQQSADRAHAARANREGGAQPLAPLAPTSKPAPLHNPNASDPARPPGLPKQAKQAKQATKKRKAVKRGAGKTAARAVDKDTKAADTGGSAADATDGDEAGDENTAAAFLQECFPSYSLAAISHVFKEQHGQPPTLQLPP